MMQLLSSCHNIINSENISYTYNRCKGNNLSIHTSSHIMYKSWLSSCVRKKNVFHVLFTVKVCLTSVCESSAGLVQIRCDPSRRRSSFSFNLCHYCCCLQLLLPGMQSSRFKEQQLVVLRALYLIYSLTLVWPFRLGTGFSTLSQNDAFPKLCIVATYNISLQLFKKKIKAMITELLVAGKSSNRRHNKEFLLW